MSTKPIPGHISVALAVVYVVAKVAELHFSEEQFKALDAAWKSYAEELTLHRDGERIKHWTTWTEETEPSSMYYNRKFALCWQAHISFARETKDKTYSTAYRFDKVVLNYYDGSLAGKTDAERRKAVRYASFVPPYTSMLDSGLGLSNGGDNAHNLKFPPRSGLVVDFIIDRLKSGKLKSFLRTSDGFVIEAPPEYWLTDQSEDILMHDVHTLVRHPTGSYFGKLSVLLEDADEVAYQFDDADSMNNPKRIFSFYPHHYSTGPNITPEPVTLLPNNRGGRPPVYDEIAFAKIVLKILWQNGRPKTKAELVKMASDQYEIEKLRGGRPSPEYARKKIAALWDDFDLGEET